MLAGGPESTAAQRMMRGNDEISTAPRATVLDGMLRRPQRAREFVLVRLEGRVMRQVVRQVQDEFFCAMLLRLVFFFFLFCRFNPRDVTLFEVQ